MTRKIYNRRINDIFKILFVVSICIVGTVYVFTRFIAVDISDNVTTNVTNNNIETSLNYIETDTTSEQNVIDNQYVYEMGGLLFSSGEQIYITTTENTVIINKVSSFIGKEIIYSADYEFTQETVSHGEDDVLIFDSSVKEFLINIDIINVSENSHDIKKVRVVLD